MCYNIYYSICVRSTRYTNDGIHRKGTVYEHTFHKGNTLSLAQRYTSRYANNVRTQFVGVYYSLRGMYRKDCNLVSHNSVVGGTRIIIFTRVQYGSTCR